MTYSTVHINSMIVRGTSAEQRWIEDGLRERLMNRNLFNGLRCGPSSARLALLGRKPRQPRMSRALFEKRIKYEHINPVSATALPCKQLVGAATGQCTWGSGGRRGVKTTPSRIASPPLDLKGIRFIKEQRL